MLGNIISRLCTFKQFKLKNCLNICLGGFEFEKSKDQHIQILGCRHCMRTSHCQPPKRLVQVEYGKIDQSSAWLKILTYQLIFVNGPHLPCSVLMCFVQTRIAKFHHNLFKAKCCGKNVMCCRLLLGQPKMYPSCCKHEGTTKGAAALWRWKAWLQPLHIWRQVRTRSWKLTSLPPQLWKVALSHCLSRFCLNKG